MGIEIPVLAGILGVAAVLFIAKELNIQIPVLSEFWNPGRQVRSTDTQISEAFTKAAELDIIGLGRCFIESTRYAGVQPNGLPGYIYNVYDSNNHTHTVGPFTARDLWPVNLVEHLGDGVPLVVRELKQSERSEAKIDYFHPDTGNTKNLKYEAEIARENASKLAEERVETGFRMMKIQKDDRPIIGGDYHKGNKP